MPIFSWFRMLGSAAIVTLFSGILLLYSTGSDAHEADMETGNSLFKDAHASMQVGGFIRDI